MKDYIDNLKEGSKLYNTAVRKGEQMMVQKLTNVLLELKKTRYNKDKVAREVIDEIQNKLLHMGDPVDSPVRE